LQRYHAFWLMLILCTLLNLSILVLSSTLVYLIWTEISAILFFYTNVYDGLNVKYKTIFVAFLCILAYVNNFTMLNLYLIL